MLAKTYNLRQVTFRIASLGITLAFGVLALLPNYAYAVVPVSGGGGGSTAPASTPASGYYCGGGTQAVHVSIDLGCQHKGNPILDVLFAIIRLLSDGVGLVVIASLVLAGIQFTSSSGDPQASAKAVKRIQGNVIALLIFFFAYAILNYVVPGQVL